VAKYKKIRQKLKWTRCSFCFSIKFRSGPSPTILDPKLWPVSSPQEINFFIKVIEIFSPKGQGHYNLLPFFSENVALIESLLYTNEIKF